MYEEKSTEQIAAQVGLSENATRQLIFRARAAFKKALIGDVDTTGMSAAAILSVAARKAASEGKKVGAAALTLIALVVMSMTVFPGLNRAPSDQMAGAPNPGTSQEAGQSSDGSAGTGESEDEIEIGQVPDNGIVDDAGAEVTADAQVAAAPAAKVPGKAKKSVAEAVLSAPALGSILNADSRSLLFVLDQEYTAVGENGLIASFTFNPTAEVVFTQVEVQVQLATERFTFKPVNPILIEGKTAQNEPVFLFVGEARDLLDSSGKAWPETDLARSKVKIEVLMESNGSTVKSINLLMFEN
jgi:RNA polymerase sigma-70 factor (ECF subfamily)